jgi:hypothetical protein
MPVKEYLAGIVALGKMSGSETIGVPEAWILKLGSTGKSAELPAAVKRGTIGHCFENAAKLALADEDLTYVEGFAVPGEMGMFPLHHAWVVDEDDNVIDPTWSMPEHGSYFGVKFSMIELSAALLKNEHWGILSNGVTWDAELMKEKGDFDG